MKRIIAVLLLAAMSLSLCACGEAPKSLDKDTYSYGKEALTVMDDYLSGKIDADEAEEKLVSISKNLDTIDIKSKQEEAAKSDPVNSLNILVNYFSICDHILAFRLGMKGVKDYQTHTVPDCQEERDSLAKILKG